MVNPAPAPSSRAAEALDALIRERERRPLFRRRDPHDPFARPDRAARPGPTPDRPFFELAPDAASSPVLVDEPYAPDGALDAGDAPSDEERAARAPSRGSTRGPRDPRDLRALLELDPRRVPRAWARAVVVAVVVLVVVIGLVGRRVLARPAALDDRLPIATASAAPGAEDGPAAAPPSAPPGATSGGGAGSGSSTTVAGAGPVFVHVAGAVVSPGVVQLGQGSRVVDAVGAAGGLRPDADADRVNLAAPLVDGSRVVVPTVGQEPATELSTVPPPSTGASDSVAGGEGSAAPGAMGAAGSGNAVPLNTASAAQLDELPGVGPSTAQAILEHREREGPFTSVEGLLDVRGIGEAKLEALRDLVSIG